MNGWVVTRANSRVGPSLQRHDDGGLALDGVIAAASQAIVGARAADRDTAWGAPIESALDPAAQALAAGSRCLLSGVEVPDSLEADERFEYRVVVEPHPVANFWPEHCSTQRNRLAADSKVIALV